MNTLSPPLKAMPADVAPYLGRMLDTDTSLIGDCAVLSFTNPNNISTVTGVPPAVHGTSADRQDLLGLNVPSRTDGRLSEQKVPLPFNRRVRDADPACRLRNDDVSDFALNQILLAQES